MKRKIFSILFALVLVLSFSLVTAVPAAAVATPEVSKWTEYADPIFGQGVEGPKAYYPSIIYDIDGFSGHGVAAKYKMWYGTGDSQTGLATSDDGISWTDQGIVMSDGYHATVEYYSDGFSGANSGDDPSDVTMYYRMWYWDVPTLYAVSAIGYTESPDGVNWYNYQPCQNGTVQIVTGIHPEWNRGSYGPSDVLYNPGASNTGTDWTFTMYYDGTTGGDESIGVGFSSDGIIWTGYDSGEDGKADPVLVGSVSGWDGGDSGYVSRSTVIKGDDGIYRMWFSGGIGEMNAGIGYATSSDGLAWTKDANNPIFHKDDGVAWRAGRSYCPAVIEDSGVYKMWFTGVGSAYSIGYATNTNVDPDYTTIQDAINIAGDGDTITVAAGTYDPFTVAMKTGLTIQSDGVVTVEGAQSVIIYTPSERGCVVFVKDSTNIVLEGLDIEGLGLTALELQNYGVIYENSSGEINDCTVSPNTRGDELSIAIAIWFGSEVTVDTCTIHNFGRVGMLIYEACTVEVLDSTIEGPLYSVEGKACYGIEVEGAFGNDDSATASHVTIRDNEIYNFDNTFYEVTTLLQSGGVYINGWLEHMAEADSTVIVENNDIHDNYSGIIVIKSPTSYAHFNNIYDNRVFGVEIIPAYDATTAVFDATNNWWGDASGPYHTTTNLNGTDNEVSNNVHYSPWCAVEETDLVTPGYQPPAPMVWGVSTDGTIQAAINAADTGDTINVAAGTYTEHLTITDKSNLTIQSTEDAEIVPTITPWKTPIIKVDSSTDITIRGLVIDGKNEVDPSSYSWGATATGVGIVFIDSTGTIEGNKIRNFKLHSYPVERRWKPIGTGIIVTDNCSQVTIEGNDIKSYQASGIRLFYGADADIINIIDNVITGIDAQSWYSGESIRIDANGTVNIIGNELRDNIYNDEYGAEGEATGVTICGVHGLPVVNIRENDILNNTFGIMVEKAEGAVVEAHFNNIIGNGVAGTAPNRGGAAAQDVLEGHGDPDVWPISTTLNATHNWWGHPSGPSHELSNGKWVGKGDKVSGNVDYKPWLHKSKEKVVPTKKPAFAQSVVLDNTGEYGWNTFSAPIFLDEEADTWQKLWKLTDLDYSVAYRFDSDNQTFVDLETEDEYTINPGEGFFIKMNDVGSLTILYSTKKNLTPPTRPLTAGWNLIGLANLQEMDVEVAFASIAEAPGLAGYSQVVSPIGNVTPGAVLAKGKIYVGESYWVYMLGARTLAGFTMTPVDWVP